MLNLRSPGSLLLSFVASTLLYAAPAGAQGFLDTAKSLGQKASEVAGNKAVEGVKKAAGKSITGKLEAEVNKRLLDEARKNQCVFKTDSDEFEKPCTSQMQKVASTLLSAKKKLTGAGISGFKFEVSGHTDTRGSADHNKELSAKRAAVLVRELIAKGVKQEEIVSVGRGSEAPLVTPDDTPAKQAKNRRYELRVRL